MINLLPPQKKKKADNELKKRTAITLMFFLVIFLVFLSATVYGLKCYSLRILEKEKGTFLQERQGYLDITNKKENIEDINNLTEKINKLKKESTDFNLLFTKINSTIPGESKIDEIQYQKIVDGSDEIILTGELSNWEDLIQLESGLKKEFSEVKFSSESWTQTEDVNFMVKFVNHE